MTDSHHKRTGTKPRWAAAATGANGLVTLTDVTTAKTLLKLTVAMTTTAGTRHSSTNRLRTVNR